MRVAHLLACAAVLSACIGTTGNELVTFRAAAAGPADADPARPFAFDTSRGFRVTLTQARLHIGALYLNQSQPIAGAQETTCVLPGTYVGEVTSGLDVNLLSPAPQSFPAAGDGTASHALAAEVWLNGGEFDREDDPTPILQLDGTAEKAGKTWPFHGVITIGQNRAVPPSDSSQPGSHPICKERIVSPIPVDLTPAASGSLLVRVDPRELFVNVDFARLHQASNDPPRYEFKNDSADSDQPSTNLYWNLHGTGKLYSFEWTGAN